MSIDPVTSNPANSNAPVRATNTAHRVTPSDGPTFGEVMKGSAQQLLRGAAAAVQVLPSGPIVAASIRPGALHPSIGSAASGGSTMRDDLSADGLGGSAQTAAEPAVEGALARSQDMNIYLIELQERAASQNRAFTTYSNVLKSKHDTVKNAINNIR